VINSHGKDFEVSGMVMPGATLKNITNLSAKGISTLGKKDVVITWGGANDINKYEVNNGLKYLKNFININQNTNIIVVTAPHRHDLQESSCVNREVDVFNRKLHKIVKIMDNVMLLQTKLNRNDFTCHGLHLNISGKVKIAELIGEHILNLTKKKDDDFIMLKWKENWNQPVEEENNTKLIKDKKQEPNRIKVRSSKRQRHYPATRSEYCLWTGD
jgi:hypothetical protein